MLKKITSLFIITVMAIVLTGCSSGDTVNEEKENKEPTNVVEREFVESKGMIKYVTIEGNKVAIPETVGEYVRYLEKLGKVELGETEKSIEEAPMMEASERASLASFLKVYTTDKEYQSFGINYVNLKDKKSSVSQASVTRITLIYDIYADLETNPGDQTIKTMVLSTTNGDIPINGKTTSTNLIKILGTPTQNTDGYLKYTDEAGFTYKFATENQKGILTQVQIDYPKN